MRSNVSSIWDSSLRASPTVSRTFGCEYGRPLYAPNALSTTATTSGFSSATRGVRDDELTFGTLYNEATDFVKGGCGGRWLLTGEDIKPTKSY
jgi:hypothetical protein